MRLITLSLLVPCLAAGLRGQPYGTDLISIAGGGIFNSVILYELDLSGQVRIVHAFPVTQRPSSLALDTDNRKLVFDNTNPFRIDVFDPDAGRTVATLHAGAPLRDVLAVRPFHTGDYLVADGLSASAVRVVRADGSGVSTLWTQSDRINALAQDLLTGEVLVGRSSISGPCLVRLDPRSGNISALDPTPRTVRSLVQDHRDGSVYYGTSDDTIFRWDPSGGVSTFLPGNNPAGVQSFSLAFDRAAGDGVLVAGGTRRIARVDFAAGGAPTVVAVHDGLPQNPVAAEDVAFRAGRNVSPRLVGSSNRWRFDLSFPNEAGHAYVLAFSVSGFAPGFRVGSRTIPLVPDAVLAASTTGGLAPFLRQNVGTLDARGRATATLDLSSFSRISGLRIWTAAVTFDGTAMNVLRTVSKPAVFVLE